MYSSNTSSCWFHDEKLTRCSRPAFSLSQSGPGSDLAGETAAALAASSVFFSIIGDTEYAGTCLEHARTLLDFADNYRGELCECFVTLVMRIIVRQVH